MEDPSTTGAARFGDLAMALNALDRARANERLLSTYKCPCTECKGGGRPILCSTIETHLRRSGRDPTLKRSMLPEDSDMADFNDNNIEGPPTTPPPDCNTPEEQNFDKGFDFERMTTEWFQGMDGRRESSIPSGDNEEGGPDDAEHDFSQTIDQDMGEWLKQTQVPLYHGSKISALACVLVLMNLAHLHNVSNSFMDKLFSFLRLDVLPLSNELPKTRHEARRFIDRLGLSFNTIHACRNGCILFWKDRGGFSECPKCNSSRYVEGSSSIPVKVLRHFPLIPRLLRMYCCRDIAALMRWHEKNASTDRKVRSVLDSPAWKEVKSIDRAFFEEFRNIKLGLALDGMNPFADKSTRHSTWLVFLLNYNLPGWMVTKRFFVMLSLIILGKESVKSANIDVYLEPLVEKLLLLWDGIPAVDMSDSPHGTSFTLRGMLLWTIHDYPAYGLISGCTTKGYQGCPICGPQVESRFSKSLKKNIFLGHRRYLPQNHPFKFMKESFNGKEERRQKPTRVSGIEHRRRGEARERWIAAGGMVGSENDPVKRNGIKRHVVLFKLPYWDRLLVRHILDIMHCERNITENLLKTLLGMKDGPAVRNDMKEVGCKKALHLQKARPPQTGFYMPIAPYVLTIENKRRLIERLRNLKTPTGYMSNLKSKIDLDGTLHGLKSHDYHALMQVILPVCVRGLLPDRVAEAIIRLSSVFRRICSKVLDPMQMESLTDKVAIVLCLFERTFPPSFFDTMSHLSVHLVEELELCGPVHNRWMYPLERYMKYMKSYVRNKARPEGCMATGTAMEVGLGLSTEYILECDSTRKCVWDAEEELGDSGEVPSTVSRSRNLSSEECQWAHACVLNNSSCMEGLRKVHKQLSLSIMHARASYRQGVHPRRRKQMNYPIELEEIPQFPQWLQSVVQAGNESYEDDVVDLSTPPSLKARSFKSLKAYGKQFRVSSAEENLVTADSGITVMCETDLRSGPSDRNHVTDNVTYFGKIREIIELNYGRQKPILLLCDWVVPICRGPTACMKKDKYGYTLLKLNRLMRTSANSFVFPAQASQVFYCDFIDEPEWSVVVHVESRSSRVYEEADQDCSAAFLDMDNGVFVEHNFEVHDDDEDGSRTSSDVGFEYITEQDLMTTEVAVQNEADRMEEEGSDDDTLMEFDVQEDENLHE